MGLRVGPLDCEGQSFCAREGESQDRGRLEASDCSQGAGNSASQEGGRGELESPGRCLDPGAHPARGRLTLAAPNAHSASPPHRLRILDMEAPQPAVLSGEQSAAELFQELAGVSSVSGLQMVLKLLIKTVQLGPSLGGMNS